MKVTQKIHNVFEFHVFVFTIFFHLLLLSVLSIKSGNLLDIASFKGQIGTIAIFIGFLLRVVAIDTKRYLETIKITGIYAICRQPILIADALVVLGFNIIAGSLIFTVVSILFFLIFEVNYFWQYDKILQYSFKDVYKIYARYIHFVIPAAPKLKDLRIYKINLHNIINNNQNKIIFILIYLFLILSSFLQRLYS